MKSPQQAIFDVVFSICLDLGYDTYNYLPPEDAGLPFVYVGEQFDQDLVTKDTVYGNVQQRIHIYGDLNDRIAVSTMVNEIRQGVRRLRRADGFCITVIDANAQMGIEDVSGQQLTRGLLEVEFRFN